MHGRVLFKKDHHFFNHWVVLGWVMSSGLREFERRDVIRTHWQSVRRLSDLSCAVLDLVTDDTWYVSNECCSCLAETIGYFNDILELLFYNYLFSLHCEYKVYVIYSECSHLKEKVTN